LEVLPEDMARSEASSSCRRPLSSRTRVHSVRSSPSVRCIMAMSVCHGEPNVCQQTVSELRLTCRAPMRLVASASSSVRRTCESVIHGECMAQTGWGSYRFYNKKKRERGNKPSPAPAPARGPAPWPWSSETTRCAAPIGRCSPPQTWPRRREMHWHRNRRESWQKAQWDTER
jgi:hypothetical protein